MRPLIEFKHVRQTYGKQVVIKDFSLQIKSGEIVVLFGPSGCGKTTILNLAVDVLQPSSGSIEKHTDALGYVFQEPRLLPWRTILDNVKFVVNKQDITDEQAMKTLQQVGLESYAEYYPNKLSGGMKQRVSIARALVAKPEMILMDEPFSALDLVRKQELQEDVIQMMNEQNIGILYVTHDAKEAVKMADRFMILTPYACQMEKEMMLTRHRCERDDTYLQEKYEELCQCIIGGNYCEKII